MGQARFAFLDHPGPLAVAHRGGLEAHPENTLAALEHTVGLGYRYVEVDVRASRDGIACLFHDATLERLTAVSGRLAERSWAELGGLRVAGREAIPRLDEVLAAWPDLRLVLDIKSDDAVAPLAEALRRADALDRVCVGAFSDRRLRRARRHLGPRLCTSLGRAAVTRLWLSRYYPPAGMPRATRALAGAAQVPARHRGLRVVDRRLLAVAGRRGLQVHVWTINDEAEMERLFDLGVHGIMTDRPAALKAVLARRGQWTGG